MTRSLHLRRNTNPRKINPAIYSCYMTSEDHGGRLRYDFDPDPTKILWGMQANIITKQTRGGQVSYSAGRQIGPLQIIGYTRSRWDLKELGDFVNEHMNEGVYQGAPLRFVYPERDVDFLIYIQSLDNIGYDGENGEIQAYTLTAAITQDHSSLTQVKQSTLIDNPLLESVEWIDVQRALEIAEQRFGSIVGVSTDELESSGDTPPDEGDQGNTPTDSPEDRQNFKEIENQGFDPSSPLPGPGDRGERSPRRPGRGQITDNYRGF